MDSLPRGVRSFLAASWGTDSRRPFHTGRRTQCLAAGGSNSQTLEHKIGDILAGKNYTTIKAEQVEGGSMGLIVLDRPQALNALSKALMIEVVDACQAFDGLEKVGAMVITAGSQFGCSPRYWRNPSADPTCEKSRAMEMILTGIAFLNAKEAAQRGLVSRVILGHNEALVAEAVAPANGIFELSRPSVAMAKEAVNAAYETSLQEGIKFEHSLFCAAFALEDQNEGMSAFVEKRKPKFQHK